MRVAVVGVGVIGKTHIQVIEKSGQDLVALCDVDGEKLAAYPDIPGYGDYLAMLNAVKPDAVHICTPHYLHADMVVEALSRGIHVLCEKPLCIREADIDRVLAAERASSAKLGVCFQHRFDLSTAFAEQYLKDKEIRSAHGTVFWHRDAAYYAQAEWRGTWKMEGGGVLINQAIHTVDLLQHFVGMPTSLVAWCANISLADAIETEDTATLLCRGEKDFSLTATNAACGDHPVEIVLKTKTDTVRVRSGGVFINDTYYDKDSMDALFGKPVYGKGHSALIRDFYDCVVSGRKFPIDGEEGAKAVRIVLAAYRSKGYPVTV